MMAKELNNFERLLEQDAQNFDPVQKAQIHSRISSSFESLRLIGQLVDVYVPKMVDVLIVASGGDMEVPSPILAQQPSSPVDPPPHLGQWPPKTGPAWPDGEGPSR